MRASAVLTAHHLVPWLTWSRSRILRLWLLGRGLPDAQAGGGPDSEAKTEDLPWGLLVLQPQGACCDCVVPMWASALEPSLQAPPSSAPLPIPPQLVSSLLGRPSQLSPWEAASVCFQHHLEDRTGQALPPPHAAIGPCRLPRVGEMGTRRQIRRTGPEPAIGP